MKLAEEPNSKNQIPTQSALRFWFLGLVLGISSMEIPSSRSFAVLPLIRRLFNRSESGLLLAIVAVVLLTTAVDSQHVYWHRPKDSLQDILRQTAMLGIFSLGSAIVIIAGGIDLSTG